MKLRKIFIGACTLAIMGLNLNVTAQNTLQAKPEKSPKMETTKKEKGGTPEQNANSMTLRLQKILNLTPDQVKKVYKINLRAASALSKLEKGAKNSNQTQVAAINKSRNEDIKKELDDTQLMKFERITNQREGSVRGSARSAEKKLARMNEVLNLTTEQEKLVLASLQKYELMMDEVVKNANSEGKQTAMALQKLRSEQKQEVMLHLTKEQIVKLEDSEKKGHRGNARGGKVMKDQKGYKVQKGEAREKHDHDHEGHDHEGHDHNKDAKTTDVKQSYSKDVKEDAKTTAKESRRVVKSQSNKKVVTSGATSSTGTGVKVGSPSEKGDEVTTSKPAGATESRAATLTDQMTKLLGLSKQQAKKVLGINTDAFESIAKLGVQNTEERTLALEQIHKKRTTAISGLLTRDQLGKFMETNAKVIDQMNLPMRGKKKRMRKMQDNKGRN